jgi:hypothetical protein
MLAMTLVLLAVSSSLRMAPALVTTERAVEAPPALPPVASRSVSAPPPEPATTGSTGLRREVLIAGGVMAGLALGAGVLFAVVSNSKAREFDRALKALATDGGPSACVSGKFVASCDALHALGQEMALSANISVWSFIGAGAIGAGTAIYALAAPKTAHASPAQVVPVVSAQGGGMIIVGVW